MSVFSFTEGDVDFFSLETNPKIYFSSGSMGVEEGRVYVHPRRSSTIKEEKGINTSSVFNDSTDSDRELKIQNPIFEAGISLKDRLNTYLNDVNSVININPYRDIKRLTPQYSGSSEYVNYLKSTISGTLMPAYKHVYTNSRLEYTNYSCLNFISSSATPTDSALIYCNVDNRFTTNEDFTINFHINIRNKHKFPLPGTVIHLPGNYAVSVIGGSQQDELGACEKYGLLIQLGSSARSDSYPWINSPTNIIVDEGGLAWEFDNVLQNKMWHDVTICWDSKSSLEKGSLFIDGKLIETFGDITNPQIFDFPISPHLVIGNFYQGPAETMKDFFSDKENQKWGIGLTQEQLEVIGGDSNVDPDDLSLFRHVGYFELHDINVSTKVRSSKTLTKTPTKFDDYVFYLSPFFSEDSNPTAVIDEEGGTLISAFHNVSGLSTSTPYNLMIAHGSGGHVMNLHNHLNDCVKPELSPIKHKLLTQVISSVSTQDSLKSFNDLFYRDQPTLRAANLLILPCDDGNFSPRFNGIKFAKESVSLESYVVNSTNSTSYAIGESLSNEVWGQTKNQPEFVLSNIIGGPTPQSSPHPYFGFETFGGPYAPVLQRGQFKKWMDNFSSLRGDREFPGAISWKYSDDSTTQVVIFDVSNLYYGDNIMPGSVVITDSSLTGSGGQVSIRLVDDGFGGLYRSDCDTKPARFNNVGNVFYNEGIVIIKNPSLYFFGKDSYTFTCRGERNVHISKFYLTAPRNMLNLSSNPTYDPELRLSANPVDYNENMTYISGFNLHDDNFTVVARAKLAQPILKRDFMKIGFKMKIDF